MIDEFIAFSQLDQYKSQLINEADDDLQELLKKIKQKKIESTILEEEVLNLKKEIKDEKRKFNEQQQEFFKDPSICIKNFGISINENFEKSKKMFSNAIKFLLEQLSIPLFRFNTAFDNLNFSGNGRGCCAVSNKGNQTSFCLCSQQLASDSKLKINLLFTPGRFFRFFSYKSDPKKIHSDFRFFSFYCQI